MTRRTYDLMDYAKGAEKKLSLSEIKRGYISISIRKEFANIIGKPVKLYVNNDFVAEKTYDRRGRIVVGMAVTKAIGDKTFKVKLGDDSVHINY